MKKPICSILIPSILLFFASVISVMAYEAMVGSTGLLLYNKFKTYNGYTLFAPMGPMQENPQAYLIDMEGYLVHKWKLEDPPGLYGELLPNGHLLIACRPKATPAPVMIGGGGGVLREYDWEGNLVWEYKMCSPTELQHHCFKRMPNGNTLILGWEKKTQEEALAKGRKEGTFPPEGVTDMGALAKDFWPDFIREVNREGETVWEWHCWDHIGTGPNQLDINYRLPEALGGTYPNFDWTHGNTVDYIPETDQVIFNSRNFSEFYLISHRTGEIEYRWGNPSAYGAGKAPSWCDDGDQVMFGPHHATPLENGNIQVFDNGAERPKGDRSRVLEVDPKTGEIVWEFAAKTSHSFYTNRQGAAQRLPNGNVLITSSGSGHIFEVTPKKEVVWDYVNPLFNGEPACTVKDNGGGEMPMMSNMIHRAYRYGKDYPGLEGKDLSKKEVLAIGCPEFWRLFGSTQ